MSKVKSIQFHDYKTLSNFSISARAKNVLVGPNNAGKSTSLGNELLNEDKALSKAQVHLADMISSNRDARDVAEFEQTIAEVRGRGAAASSNAYLQAIVQSSEQMSDAQALARMLVPLAIFHAERRLLRAFLHGFVYNCFLASIASIKPLFEPIQDFFLNPTNTVCAELYPFGKFSSFL